MKMRFWLRDLLSRPAVRPIRGGRCQAKLAVEALEHRRTPAQFTVNALTDAGAGSGVAGDLRYCIDLANATPGDDSIDFDSGVFATPQTILLSLGQLDLADITGAATITGSAAGVTISGGGASRVFQVKAGASAAMAQMTIADGNTNDTADGGGILNNGTLAVTNCALIGNSATNGGAIANTGTLTVTNCTIANNAANGATGGNGGGIENSGTLNVVNSTVSGNSSNFFFNYYYPYNYGGGSGAGINNAATGTASLKNTIVSGNKQSFNSSPSPQPADIGGTVTGTNNLTSSVSGGLEDGVDGNIISFTPLLGTLGNYGGATASFPLLPGSVAINAGTATGAPATDQRALARVGAVDIGAFESQGFTLAPVPGSTPQTAVIGAAFAKPLTVNVLASNPVEPVDGGIVSFAVQPAANGASAVGLTTADVVIAAGQAGGFSVGPNNINGMYKVAASTANVPATAFNLTNSGSVYTNFKVNTASGNLFQAAGVLSLPLAVAFASADQSGKSSITFDANVFKTAQTIVLSGAQLELGNTKHPMSITGPGKGVTIDASGLSRVFQVNAGVKASMSGLTITGGTSSTDGGGIANFGTLTLTNCTITGNAAGAGVGFNFGNGGGVFNAGTATLTNCTITGNSASGGFFSGAGGGVSTGSNYGFLFGGTTMPTTTLNNCKINGNKAANGGGVASYGNTAINNCTISANSARFSGGGVLSSAAFDSPAVSTTALSNCTITGNTAGAGGGVSGAGSVIFYISQYSVEPILSHNVTVISNSTINGNTAQFEGGGILTGFLSTTTATNSKITGNTAGTDGGGIATRGSFVYYAGGVYGTTSLTNCTVSGNSAGRDGGGVATLPLGVATVNNSTVSGNVASRDGGGISTVGEIGGYYGDLAAKSTVSNSTIHSNKASGSGGGVNNGPNATTSLIYANVLINSAGAGGGLANTGTLKVASANIVANQATSKGGGISTTAGTVTVTSSVLTGNKVSATGTAQGGAVSSENSVLSLTNCVVAANRVNGTTALGGGVYASASTVTLQGVINLGNWAAGTTLGQGGGIYISDSVLTFLGGVLAGNKASTNFDNIYIGP